MKIFKLMSLVILSILLLITFSGFALGASLEPEVTLRVPIMVATGQFEYSCTLWTDGIWAWGYNAFGQLGDGTYITRTNPVKVMVNSTTPLTGITKIAGGDGHTIALKSDGTVWTWGLNFYGQLGDGTTNNARNYSNKVMANSTDVLTGITDIAGGAGYTIALKSDGTVWTWGWNYFGQLGDGTTNNRNYANKVMVNSTTPLTGIKEIGPTIALKSDGTVWTWGGNYKGQLGDGTTNNRNYPVKVRLDDNGIIGIAGGYRHTIALKLDGTVWAWGRNNYGQLGDGTNQSKNIPVKVIMPQ
jgi:hypothetical protein